MSTRANIVVKQDGHEPLWFYRHSDGYPQGAMPLLEKFMDYVRNGKIRDNIGQACGWLIVLGHLEYRPTAEGDKERHKSPQFTPEGEPFGWKVGAIEPTSWGLHQDTEFLYTLDLTAKTIKCEAIRRDYGTPRDYNKEPTVTFEAVETEPANP